jgi:predicted negative regulator of RcsB-dependent stress response
MAVYDLEEQEQISQIKAWWSEYGSRVVGLVLAVSIASVSWQGWRLHQSRVAGESAATYFKLQQAAEASDAQETRDLAGRLISDYSASVQAQLGVLLAANVQFGKNELDNARVQLEWAADEGRDPALRDLARLRLAVVLLQQGAADEALARLDPAPDGAYRARFEDLRGDVLAMQGKPAEARAAWQAAIDALEADGEETAARLRMLIRAKLESLEG